jgi:uncharacterized membrane protein YfcA
MKFWKTLRREIKERFINFETVQGLYLLPCGIIGMAITWSHLQYILQAMGTSYFGYLILTGAWKVYYNPIKQKFKRNKLVQDREFRAGVR